MYFESLGFVEPAKIFSFVRILFLDLEILFSAVSIWQDPGNRCKHMVFCLDLAGCMPICGTQGGTFTTKTAFCTICTESGIAIFTNPLNLTGFAA